MDYKDVNIRKTHIAMLIALCKADDIVHYKEKEFIFRVAYRLGFSEKDVFDIVKKPEDISINFPDSYDDRLEILISLLYMMKADGEIIDSEKEMVRELGLKLIGDPPVIDDLIQIMIKYVNDNVPTEDLLIAIRKYHN